MKRQRAVRQAALFLVLAVLASMPNIGHMIDETMCVSPACSGVKLQNPVLLPYAWFALPESKCSVCTLAESCVAVLTSPSFPVIHVMNLIVAVSYLGLLTLLIDEGFERARRQGLLSGKKWPHKGR